MLLSLSPGVGHLYAGHVRGAGAALLIEYLLSSTLGWLLFWNVGSLVACILTLLAWRVVVGRSALQAAHASGPPAWRPRMAVTAIACAVVVLFNMTLGYRMVEQATLSKGSAFRIRSSAMEPSLVVGDYVITRVATAADLERDQLVVYTARGGGSFVHRAVALATDTVEMRDGELHRNGERVSEPYAWRDSVRAEVEVASLAGPDTSHRPRTYNWGPVVVPHGHFVVLGDNRGNSLDSRYLGFLPDSTVTHRPLFVYFSVSADSGVRWERIGLRLSP